MLKYAVQCIQGPYVQQAMLRNLSKSAEYILKHNLIKNLKEIIKYVKLQQQNICLTYHMTAKYFTVPVSTAKKIKKIDLQTLHKENHKMLI